MATPVSAVPVAAPVTAPAAAEGAPAAPAAEQAGDDAFAFSADPAAPGASPQRRRSKGWIRLAAVLAVLLGGLVGLYFAVWPWLQKQQAEAERAEPPVAKGPPGQKHVSRDFSYQFIIPGKPWDREESLKVPLKANLLTMRRTGPDVYLALAAQDYKRTPHDAEVVEEAVRRLGGYFTNFEWDKKGDDQLGGKPAQRLVFQGEVNKVPMSGQCYVLASKDIAYWLIMWAPAADVAQAADEFTEIPPRFTVLEREGWTEKRPPETTFQGTKAGYVLRDTKGVWEKWPQPQEADPAADLYLHGKDPAEPKNVAKMANVLVLMLPKQGDLPAALKSARDHLLAQEQKDNPGVTVEDLPKEQAATVGGVPGQVALLQVKGQSRDRFVMLAVVNLPEAVLAIQCDCDLKRRSLWERDFNQLLGTFSLKAK